MIGEFLNRLGARSAADEWARESRLMRTHSMSREQIYRGMHDFGWRMVEQSPGKKPRIRVNAIMKRV